MPSAVSDAADGIHEATEGVFLERIGVIFDCDGTLIDSMGVWRELEEEMARRAGAALAPADIELINTLTIPESGRYFHERFGLGSSSEEVVGMMNDFILGYYRDRAEARLGVMDFIDALAQRGVAMTVAS